MRIAPFDCDQALAMRPEESARWSQEQTRRIRTRQPGSSCSYFLLFPEQRGRDIGSPALQLLERELEGKGYRSIALNVHTATEQAVHAYRKPGDRTTELVMSKELQAN